MTGTWDHLAADTKRSRLFISAEQDNAVQVIDLRAGRALRVLKDDFKSPQGQYYLPALDELVVTSGESGTCKIFLGETLKPVRTLQLSVGADMMEYDPQHKVLYIDHGGEDSGRGPGNVAVVDVSSSTLVGNIKTGLRPGAMALELKGPHLYVTLPGGNQIGVIDRASRSLVTHFAITGTEKPVSLALDEINHRLFVGTRTPAQFLALDTASGKTVSTLECIGGMCGMSFDAAHRRIYATGTSGYIQAYQQDSSDHYHSVALIPTAAGAGTSLLIPELNRFCVPVPPHENHPAEIWVFETLP